MRIEVKKITKLTGHIGAIYTLYKGTDAHLIFSGGGDKTIAQWNLETFEPRKLVARLPAVIYSICHIPEKQLLLAGTSIGNVHVLDLEKNQEIKILKNHTSEVFDIKYSNKSYCLP